MVTANFTLTPLTAVWNGQYGYYDGNVYIRYYNGYYSAGEVTMAINGTNYQAYCIDLYTEINPGGTLWVNGPLPGTSGRLNSQTNWSYVNYIINNYTPTSNDMAAAIQCAIWYFTSAPYGAYPGNNTNYPGYYQFMTFNGDSTYPADGVLNGGSTTVRTEAWQIINATKAAPAFQYPFGITLSPNTNEVANGGTQTLTATVTDTNGKPLSGITVNFVTDSGKLSSSSGPTNANGQVTTTLSNVPNSSTADVTASVSGNYGASLYDSPSKPQQNLVTMSLLPYSLSATSNINFDATANVALTQTGTTPVNVGNTVTYTVTATGQGPTTATGILIDDVAPSGLSGVTYTPSAGTTYYNGVWTIPSLASGATATLTIKGTATSTMAGQNTINTANRTYQNQYNSQSPVSTATVYTKKADVVLTQTANSPVNVGDTVTYTITATNNGPDTATNIQIDDTAPALGGVTITPSTGTTYTGGVWTIPSLASGSTATLTVNGTATIPMSGTSTPNSATQTAQTEYTDQYTTTTSNVYTKKAVLTITNTGNPTSVNVGDTVTFTINVKNTGPDTASNININDAVPTGFTLTSSSASQGAYTNGVWNIGSLASGSSATLTLTGKANSAAAGGYITNHATETQTEYPAATITDATIYVKDAAVSVTNVANPTTGNVGNTGTFTVTATNGGPDSATGVVINDPAPAGFTGMASAGTTYTGGVWTIGTLAKNGSATLTFTGTLTSGEAGTTITNAATETQNEYPPVTIPNASIYVKNTSVTVTNVANPTTGNVGNPATFTVTATNGGPDSATGVVINDPAPAGFVGTPSAGTTYTGGVWTIGTLAKNGSATLTFTGTLTSGEAGTTITNSCNGNSE